MPQIDIPTAEKISNEVYDAAFAAKYRSIDDGFTPSRQFRRVAHHLANITGAFNRPITVLEAGCGTGRYFHTLRNTASLTGIDISPDMLAKAASPVKKEQIQIPEIKLINANIHDYDFSVQTFDFIYSIGVLGEYTPFTVELAKKLYALLKPGGVLYFTVYDADEPAPVKFRIAQRFYSLMPARYKMLLDHTGRRNFMTYEQFGNIMQQSGFEDYSIDKYPWEDAGVAGGHLECFAYR